MSKKTKVKRPSRENVAASGGGRELGSTGDTGTGAGRSRSRVETVFAASAATVLALIYFLRVMVDGYVYPYWNFHFLVAALMLFTAWAALALLRTVPFRWHPETLLLGGFVLWAAGGLTYSIQYDATFRALLLWITYAAVFVVAANALTTRLSLAILIGGFAFTTFAEALWSLVHAQYILPLVRAQIQNDPELLRRFFGVDEATGDLGHRLQSNRAFGTFLFPNALGAYMALAGPIAAAGSLSAWRAYQTAQRDGAFLAWAREAQERGRGNYHIGVLALAIGATVAAFAGAYLLASLIVESDVLGRSWFNHPVPFWLTAGAMPLAVGAAVMLSARTYGFPGFLAYFRLIGYPVLTLVTLGALYASFSRGAMLALVVASAFTLIVVKRPPAWLTQAGRTASIAVALGILIVASLVAATPGEAAAQGRLPQPATIDIAGATPTVSEAVSGATFGLRVGYWRVGLRMWLDNPLGGVGLGNFGTAYPAYQFVGASDVKTAHNDFLQIATETGPIGLLLFGGFWSIFFARGARRLLSMQESSGFLFAAGLYAGLMAFVLHAVVDFNFVNPSLTLPLFILAGGFLAITRQTPHPSREPSWAPYALIPVLVLVALAAGAATRAHQVDTQLRRLGEGGIPPAPTLEAPLQAANYLLVEATATNARPDADFHLPIHQIVQLIPDRAALESLGMIVAPTGNPNSPWRRVTENERLEQNWLVIIRNFAAAQQVAREYGVRRADLIAAVDAGYPHRQEIAAHLFQWHYLLANNAINQNEAKRHGGEALRWARDGISRSRMHPWFHSFEGQALFLLAGLEGGRTQEQLMEEGLEGFRMAAELIPLQTDVAHEYAYRMKEYAQLMADNQRPMRSDLFFHTADAIHDHAMRLQEQINAWRYGTPAAGEENP